MAAFLLAPKGLDLVHSVARLRLASSLTGQASSDGEVSCRRRMKPELDALEEKWKSGHYTDGSILDLIHRTALKLSKIFVSGQYGDYHDPYWHVKEKLIVFGAQQGWRDVLELYEGTLDRDNRWRVYHAYEELKDIPKMLKMLSGEKTAENIMRFLQGLFSKDAAGVYRYVSEHESELIKKIENAPDEKWHQKEAKEILKVINNYRKWGKL